MLWFVLVVWLLGSRIMSGVFCNSPATTKIVTYGHTLSLHDVLPILILISYGRPFVSITLSNFAAAVLALVLNNTGYFGEIFRAGLAAVPKGQYEAASALGFHRFKAMIYIVLPQAVGKVRSEEHTSELQSLMRISYAVFCLKKKNTNTTLIETVEKQ